ncbi:MAG: hypothetical protein J5708_01150 [Bacteroidales bacterium]|nr:hypothetical protein [Bacteroidales bacterium]
MKKTIAIFICLMFMIVLCGSVSCAQNNDAVVRPLKVSQAKIYTKNILVYVSGMSFDGAWVPDLKSLYISSITGGLKGELCVKKTRMSASLGYIYERMANNKYFADHYGFYSSWINFDFNIEFSIYSIGVSADCLLSYHNNYSSGDYLQDYNKVALKSYLGFNLRLLKAKFEVHAGYYFIPHVDFDIIKETYKHVKKPSGLYIEVMLSFRVFSTGNVYQINETLDD